MAEYTRKLQFDKATSEKIFARDHGECIFCQMGYHMEGWTPQAGGYDIMHFIPKSHQGMGIEQNGVLGCRYHHHMMDNGNKGLRKEMLKLLESYLRSIYPDWNRNMLIYDKWAFLNKCRADNLVKQE